MAKPLAETLADQLRRDILIGVFPPGSSIKERDNAAHLGVSRTPMREAIRILAKEGLIILRPARSPIVAQPDFKEVSDAVDVLLALERLAASQACERATKDGFAEVRKIHEDLAGRYDQLGELDLFEQDMAFHSKIVEITGNASLFSTYRTFLERLWRIRFLAARQEQNKQKMIEQHSLIVESLENRETELAVQSVMSHLGNLSNDILPVFSSEDELSEAD